MLLVILGIPLNCVHVAAAEAAATIQPISLTALPDRILLTSPENSEQLLVTSSDNAGQLTDVTCQVEFFIEPAGIVTITETGRISPLRDGETLITARMGAVQVNVPVTVTGISEPSAVSFRSDIIPVLSKSGCNSGGCHGKAEGQNGFKLSVFGFDVATDHDAIVHDGRGRRIFPSAPDRSLLLQKATAQMPHGGGRRIDLDSRWYRLMHRWISEGCELDSDAADPVVAIRADPPEATLAAHGTQQLRVTAEFQSGRSRCVTVESDFQSNHDVVAKSDKDGLVTATDVPGEAAILVRYMGHVAVCRITRPHTGTIGPEPPIRNFIDPLVWNKLRKLQISTSPPADDATVLRRTYLDIIGTLPTARETRDYLQDTSARKHADLVNRLLDRPEYSLYWAQKWSDILQVDRDVVSPAAAIAMTRWVRQQFRDNVPFDQFVSTILTAQGTTYSESPAAFYQVQADAEKTARAVSQLFLGVRIDCAQCHHHPFERWDQRDYYGLAGFFTGIDRRPIPGGATKIVSKPGDHLKHPRTSEVIPTAALGEPPATIAAGADRRRSFAPWATSPQNRFFARTIVNRLVAHYLGRGLVEPVDDLRDTNPPSNEPLMNALTEQMIAVKFDLKEFTRTLLNSQVYQLSSQPVPSNELDDQNYSRAAWKPLPAEVLLDAISQVTDVPEHFDGWPVGYRAIEIWDNKLPSHFLEVFGRPSRQTVCSCERGTESSVSQALHLMNSETTTRKLQSRNGICAALSQSTLRDAEIIDELFLTALNRYPSSAEKDLLSAAFPESADRQTAVEDILWTLLNSREFVFNH
jgi:hypothetical protein